MSQEAESVRSAIDPGFVPRLRTDLIRRDIGLESVAWSPVRSAPVALDAVATVMLSVIDGIAAVKDLARDVEEVVGLSPEAAINRVRNVVTLLDGGGLLATSPPEPVAQRALFTSPLTSCMETSSCTGAVTPINLELEGHRFRIAVASRRIARRLRRVLAPYVIQDHVPLGFMLRSERRSPRSHVLVDRGGFVLGTARGSDAALALIGNHLTAFLPPPPDAMRLRIRALSHREGVALCLWPALFVPALDERDLDATGWAVIDRLVVDLGATGNVLGSSHPWPWLEQLPNAAGHVGAAPGSVSRLVVPVPSGIAPPPRSALVAALSSEVLVGARAEVLEAMDRVVASASVVPVDVQRPGALADALRD